MKAHRLRGFAYGGLGIVDLVMKPNFAAQRNTTVFLSPLCMETLQYPYNLEFYLIRPEVHLQYWAEWRAAATDSAKQARYERLAACLYDQIKNASPESVFESVRPALERIHAIRPLAYLENPTKYAIQTWFNRLPIKQIQDAEEWHDELENAYFRANVRATHAELWFMGAFTNLIFSEEWLAYLKTALPVWEDILAGEARELTPLPTAATGEQDDEEYPTDFIIETAVLQASLEAMLNKPPKDPRLHKEYAEWREMLQRCIAGEFALVVVL